MVSATLLWLFGVGLALILMVIGILLLESRTTVRISFAPLYVLSAVRYPISSVCQLARDWLLLNSTVHRLEWMRAGYFAGYNDDGHARLAYFAFILVATLLIGLLLQTWYATRRVAR